LAELLDADTGLMELDLTETEVGDLGGLAIGMALERNTHLARLTMTGNGVGADGAAAVFASLARKGSKLRELELGENRGIGSGRPSDDVGGGGGEGNGLQGLTALRDALAVEDRQAWTLDSLDLRGCGLGDADAGLIAVGLAQNTRLRVLRLQHNQIGGRGAQQLASALVNRKNGLSTLDLEHNNISDVGAAAFGKALRCVFSAGPTRFVPRRVMLVHTCLFL
jgi:Ran GTPase-activating protein (RanGAP) involved in mRNA processing and transport